MLTSDLKHIYVKAACLAVRACSDVEQKVAEGKAIRWARSNYLKLRMDTINAKTEEEAEAILGRFVSRILDEHRFCLMNGVTALSPEDEQAIADIANEDEEHHDPRRI
jgi:hypothetical protein